MQIHSSSSAVWVTGAKGEYLCYYLHSSGFYLPALHRENTVSFLDKYSFFLFSRQSQPFPGGPICLLSLAVPPHDRSLVDWSKPLSMWISLLFTIWHFFFLPGLGNSIIELLGLCDQYWNLWVSGELPLANDSFIWIKHIPQDQQPHSTNPRKNNTFIDFTFI